MSKNITYKNTSISLMIVIAVIVAFYFGATTFMARGANPSANTSGEKVDLIGTKSGSSTVPVSFYAASTSTYPLKLGTDKSNVVFYLKSMATATAGTDAGYANLNFLASNDSYCETASTTSGILNPVITSDINWYDVSNQIKNASPITTLGTGTTTIGWAPNGLRLLKTVELENVNAKCLALQVAASSTILHVEFMAK